MRIPGSEEFTAISQPSLGALLGLLRPSARRAYGPEGREFIQAWEARHGELRPGYEANRPPPGVFQAWLREGKDSAIDAADWLDRQEGAQRENLLQGRVSPDERVICWAEGDDINQQMQGSPILVGLSDKALYLASFMPGFSRPETRFPFRLIADYEATWDEKAGAWFMRLLICDESDLSFSSLSEALKRPENKVKLLFLGLPPTRAGERVREALIESVNKFGAYDPANRSQHPLRSGN